jgi:AraC family transcriptional regulator
MQPKIVELQTKKLVGIRLSMSLANNKTAELWRAFMLQRNQVANKVNNDLVSMQIYDPTYHTNFNPANEFEKWATVEVTNFDNVPQQMETFVLPKGLYAVFDYKGLNTDPAIFMYIFQTWLPGSDYVLDQRPHFEILGDKYKNNDPESEEQIWIPVAPK